MSYKKTIIYNLALILLVAVFQSSLKAQNPILKGYADPHMKVWDGKMYISVGKDESPELGRFSIISWGIYSSSDMMNWKLEQTIMPEDTYLGKGSNKCWASDITRYNGKYYLYFSNGGKETGVLVADKPGGPYKDVLNKAMIPHSFSDNHEYDPTVLEEDNGDRYLIFGRDGQVNGHHIHYQIVKLSEDMLSLAEKPKDLLTDNFYGFGAEDRARDHQYFHKHDSTYYLSCAGAYRTSHTRYGPFENLRHSGQDGHSSFCDYNGQSYHMYEWACEPYDVRQYRQVCVTYLHYKDNGDMVDDPHFLQATQCATEGKYYKTGVGNYDASWDTIEAEWFFKREGALIKRECPNGGFELQKILDGDCLNFPNMKNMDKNTTINFTLAAIINKPAYIEVREGGKDGELLGTCEVSNTGTFKTYKTFSAQLNNSAGINDLYFVFKGNTSELMRFDSFNFSK